jgi:hypothetical protein
MQPKQRLRNSRNTNLSRPATYFSNVQNSLAVTAPQSRENAPARRKTPGQGSRDWLGVFRITTNRGMLTVAALLALHTASLAQISSEQNSPSSPASGKSAPVVPHRYHTKQLSNRAQQYYSLVWGIDSLSVKSVESGELIKFTYRVIDPNKARVLNDKKNEPFLVDPRAGVKLVVPSLEKVGQLRPSSTPEAGKVYWMAFSNKGRFVKPGHFVDVSIGLFRANSLIVQ